MYMYVCVCVCVYIYIYICFFIVGAVDLARSWMVRPQVWSLGLLG